MPAKSHTTLALAFALALALLHLHLHVHIHTPHDPMRDKLIFANTLCPFIYEWNATSASQDGLSNCS